MYKISILIIGSEILNGVTLDTNSNWISNYISTLGYSVNMIITIDDQQDKIEQVFETMWRENNLVIITGGLGPTKDDLTKKIFAKIFNKKISISEQAQMVVKENFKRLNKDWDVENSYNFIPKDFIALNNPQGLAPCFSYKDLKRQLLLLPGVPREVSAVCKDLLPSILASVSNKKNYIVTIQTFGIGEENIFCQLCPNLWNELSIIGNLGCLPQLGGVKLIVTVDHPNKKNIIINLIKNSKLNQYVWQFGEQTLAEFIIARAKEKKITFSFAESCTGGLVSSLVTDVQGSSTVFLGSAITYSNQSKSDLLNVSSQLIQNHGAVSTFVANEMALGSLKKYKSDIAISFTGIAGPGGGTNEKPVGTVSIGIASSLEVSSKMYYFKGNRVTLKERFATQGLFQLLKHIEQFNL